MMQESSVLETEEQDQLGMVLTNLEMAAALYNTNDFTTDSAKAILTLIDKAVAAMEKRGLLHGPVEKPWDNETKAHVSPTE